MAGVIATGAVAYFFGKGERERELEEIKIKVTELHEQLETTTITLKDCQERNIKHIERELRDAEKITGLRSQYDMCRLSDALTRAAFKNSYCIIRHPIPDNIATLDSTCDDSHANDRTSEGKKPLC